MVEQGPGEGGGEDAGGDGVAGCAVGGLGKVDVFEVHAVG